MKECSRCGKSADDSEKFCVNCGKKFQPVSGTYVSERITNIKDLEELIEFAHLSVCSLILGIEKKEILTAFEVRDYLKKIDVTLKKAYGFEFCIERRTTINTD